MNRNITSAKYILELVDNWEYLKLSSAYDLTHEPISDINNIPASHCTPTLAYFAGSWF